MHALVERVKATFGLQKFTIVTCDDTAATKPDPEGIEKTLKMLGIKPTEAIMVGDLEADIKAGKEARVLTVGISHGFSTVEELQKANADKVVHSLAELREFVESLNQ